MRKTLTVLGLTLALLALLDGAVAGMAALSNSTWVFEQPAPFTYPVYWPDGAGLRRVEPRVTSTAAQRALATDPAARQGWDGQLAQEDAFFSVQTFGLLWADRSPFLRLVRRSLAKAHIARREAAILAGAYPYEDVLTRMIAAFAETARADEQLPVVMLIQSRDPSDPSVLEIARPVLERDGIPYFATAEHFDPRDPTGFLPDGHYTPEIDRQLGEALLALIAP